MHYYKRNIGAYHKRAGPLTMLQHGAMTLLMDSCYDRERFPTRDEAMEWLWASSKEEIESVEFVLCRFFDLEDGVYVQKRIQDELDNYHKNAQTNKRIAIERETKRREKRTNRDRPVNGTDTLEHEPPPKQEPRTINQELLTSEETLSPTGNPPRKQVPYEDIKEIYNEQLPTLTGSRILSPKARRNIERIWKLDQRHQNREFWTSYFGGISQLTHRMDNWTGVNNGNKSGNIELITREEIFIRSVDDLIDAKIWGSA